MAQDKCDHLSNPVLLITIAFALQIMEYNTSSKRLYLSPEWALSLLCLIGPCHSWMILDTHIKIDLTQNKGAWGQLLKIRMLKPLMIWSSIIQIARKGFWTENVLSSQYVNFYQVSFHHSYLAWPICNVGKKMNIVS